LNTGALKSNLVKKKYTGVQVPPRFKNMETYNFKALSFLSKPRNPNYQHLELDPLKNLSRGSLPTEKELVMAGKERVEGGQKLQAAMMRVQADILVQIELELECVEVTVHIIGTIIVGLQHSLGYTLSRHQ
jgi:DNA-nicking Smr family endonuclease